jgi:methylmalonyl-CoA mutase
VPITAESADLLAAWRELAEPVLRRTGRSLDELTTTTDDGVRIAPLYVNGPATPETHPPVAPWDVRQFHTPGSDVTDEAEGGTTSVWLSHGEDRTVPAVVGSGLGLVLDAGARTDQAAEALFRLLRREKTPLRGNVGADPLGLTARTGERPRIETLTRLAHRCRNEHPTLRAVTVDATVYHEQGASDGAELAYALATGVAYLRALVDSGLEMNAALDQIQFRYAVGCDQWPAIAKLRAAQVLWARVVRACGAAPVRQHQHAVTSRPMMTARAPWTNIIRSTVAAFAAVAGGADAITVLPHDLSRGPAALEARRLARTTHALLRLEAGVARVQDPAAGSWYAEQLTHDLAAEGWARFRALERIGGMAEALRDGTVGAGLAAARRSRRDDVRRLRRPIVGVTVSPHPDEEPPREITTGRYAEDFELLRRRAEAGPLPAVALMPLDSPEAAEEAARAERLLQLAGVRTVRGSSDVVVLCGLDEAAGETVERLRRSGTRVWGIATPATTVPLDGHLADGGDVVTALHLLLDHLGAPR